MQENIIMVLKAAKRANSNQIKLHETMQKLEKEKGIERKKKGELQK